MPEQPPPKYVRPVDEASLLRHAQERSKDASSTGRYAELHCCTNFSFLEGASHPHELVERAAELGYAALAVTDRNSLAGVVRAHVAAKEAKLKLIIGALITPIDAPPLLLWVTNRKGYGQLSRLLTHGRRSAPKGECRLTLDDVARHNEGLLAGVLLAAGGVAPGATPPAAEIFGDRCYAVAELHRGLLDCERLRRFDQLAREVRLPLVAANDVHYHIPQRRPLHDVLTATRFGCTVAELGKHRFSNGERHLKAADQMRELFSDEWIARTIEIADRCHFSLDELRYDYPEELCPAGRTPLQHLTELTWSGAKQRYPDGVPDKVRGLIEHELSLIGELHYEAYFLTVWDLVRFARSREILCQGRGSAANSAVCYCLGVTSVNPEQIDVLFERFISKERNEAPDIDVDFEHERREEVLQYIYEKYGRERTAMTAEVITYRERSAIRDVGKALGLSIDRVDLLAKTMDHHPKRDETRLAARLREGGLDPQSRLTRQMVWLVNELLGFPRHLSQHVGGMVMTNSPLCELVPIENAAMPDRTVIEWDKYDLDDLGILKVDCLSLGMLTAIRKCFDLVYESQLLIEKGNCKLQIANCKLQIEEKRTPTTDSKSQITDDQLQMDESPPASQFAICNGFQKKEKLTLATIPPEDPRVYDMICRADTIGVFQIESRAQMSMLPRLRPREFYDLVIEVAIVRPGPIQGKMVHPYLRRRQGQETVEFPSEAVRSVLSKTLGVPIFQEQAMRLAVVAAGFTPGEADQLRRAMGAWRKSGVMTKFREKLINGMLERGYQIDFAERVYQQICGFGEYGFPESHAASFALLVYVSAWLKCYYPAAFCAAILNSLPMGFYAPAQLVGDARKHGVEVRPIDINHSGWDCTLEAVGSRQSAVGSMDSERSEVRGRRSEIGSQSSEADCQLPTANCLLPTALRLGFRLIRGLAQKHVDAIIAARKDGPFTTFAEFVRRTGLRAAALKRLSLADAFGSLHLDRRTTLWKSLPERGPRTLFDEIDHEEVPVPLPPMTAWEDVLKDYSTAGLTLRQHPMSFLRPMLDEIKITPADRLATTENDTKLRVGGIVLLRQRPSTANGITFVTLEDETGMVNLIVRRSVWEKYRKVARTAIAMIAHGRLQRDQESQIIHVLVTKLEDLSDRLADLRTEQRNFH